MSFTIIAWNEVLKQYDEIIKFDVMFEFVNAIAIVCLNYPYAIRNRFIFTATHLLHQSNSIKNVDWRDDLAQDKNINFKELKKTGARWKCFKNFSIACNSINSDEFIQISDNYRHKMHHRIPPGIEIGISPMTRVPLQNGIVSYGLGGKLPLPIENIISGVVEEHKKTINAFYAYWELIQEQLVKWKV